MLVLLWMCWILFAESAFAILLVGGTPFARQGRITEAIKGGYAKCGICHYFLKV